MLVCYGLVLEDGLWNTPFLCPQEPTVCLHVMSVIGSWLPLSQKGLNLTLRVAVAIVPLGITCTGS